MTAPRPEGPPPRQHPCPHCRCTHSEDVEMGMVNKDAPFYRLVLEADQLSRTLSV